MLSPQDFIHPEDEAARRNMEAIPGFAAAVKAFLKLGMEQYYHGVNMASKICLSEKQLPELYQKLPLICQKLNIAEPEFYLEMNPAPNAYTFGDSRIALTQSNLNEKVLEIAETSIFWNNKGTTSIQLLNQIAINFVRNAEQGIWKGQSFAGNVGGKSRFYNF